eukprot:765235-Hanusia_phi.AAC.1
MVIHQAYFPTGSFINIESASESYAFSVPAGRAGQAACQGSGRAAWPSGPGSYKFRSSLAAGQYPVLPQPTVFYSVARPPSTVTRRADTGHP